MNLENQVCSLELAKRLKELGVKQDNILFWCEIPSINEIILCQDHANTNECYKNENDIISPVAGGLLCPCYENHKKEFYSAFTAQELLSMLNAFIRIAKETDDEIHVTFDPENGTDNSYSFHGNNLADLLAQVLIAQINEGEFKNESC